MKSRKYLALLLALAMAAALLTPALATEEPALPQVEAGDTVILHTNDIHTYIDGDLRYSHIAGLKDYLEELGAAVVLIDSGDAIQGTAYGVMDQGETIHRLMVAAGYDIATLGNHEFDYGMDRALAVAGGEIPYLSCNFCYEAEGVLGETVLDAYTIVRAGDKTLAFLGITTPEAFTKSTPAYFQDGAGNYIYGIAGGTDGQALYDAVQAAIDEIRQIGGVDYICAVGHLGVDPGSSPWTAQDVLLATDGIDLFFDGHSHTRMLSTLASPSGRTAVLAQTGEYLGGIGMTVLPAGDGEAAFYLLDSQILSQMGVTPDAEVQAMEEAWIGQVDEQLGQVIGYAQVTLDNYGADGSRLVRTQATNSGAFAADALYYLFDSMGLDVDAAIMNGGGIRNKALTGELTYRSMKEIHTFGNVACLITVTGQQLLDALEWGARSVGESENGSFLHVSGLRYTVNPAIPSTVQTDDKGMWAGPPTGEYRVSDVMLLDPDTGCYVELDPAASYDLAGYNYTLRDLGDGFTMFQGAVNVLDYVMEDYMVLANYLAAFPVDETTGLPTISAGVSPSLGGVYADYSQVSLSGRVTIDESGPAAEPDTVIYTVVAGDCLWNLASRYLGRGARFGEIAALNGISDPYTIYIGQTLLLPAP